MSFFLKVVAVWFALRAAVSLLQLSMGDDFVPLVDSRGQAAWRFLVSSGFAGAAIYFLLTNW